MASRLGGRAAALVARSWPHWAREAAKRRQLRTVAPSVEEIRLKPIRLALRTWVAQACQPMVASRGGWSMSALGDAAESSAASLTLPERATTALGGPAAALVRGLSTKA